MIRGFGATDRPFAARWSAAARLVAGAGLLAILAAAALAVGRALTVAFPVTVEIVGDATGLTIAVDGTEQRITTGRPLVLMRPVGPPALRREHLVDGSDSTNMFTFDRAYLRGLSNSPYYALQSWLREDWRYSRWVSLEVHADDGSEPIRVEQPRDDREIKLPTPFRLVVHLERPEIPRELEFLDRNGSILIFEINRNDKFIRLGPRRPHDQSDLAFWYFPRTAAPMLATLVDLLTRALALALGLPLLVGLLALLPSARFRRQPDRRAARIATGAAALAFLGLGSYFAVVVFDRAPHILDALAYLFQARTFADGLLAAPPAPLPSAFPVPFTVVYNGGWFAQYPPGTAALLAVGVLLGAPWLVQPVLGAAAVALLGLTALRQYGPGIAITAVLLAATSPFLVLNAGAFLSHVPALLFASAALYGATRYADRPARRWAALIGIGLGSALLTREVVAVLYGLTVVTAGLAWGAARRPRRRSIAADLALVLGPVGAAGLLYLAYNWALTGDPAILPRLLVDGRDRYGFGEGVGFYNEHTPAAGLVNTEQQLVSLTFVLAGWPYGLSLAVPLLPFLFRRWSGWDLAHGSLVALYVGSYAAYYYHGIAFGPRYYLEALPSLVLLTARGLETLVAVVASALATLPIGAAWWRARQAAVLLAGLAVACNLLFFLPRQAELYATYSGIPGKSSLLDAAIERTVGGRASTLDDALVVSSDWWIHAMYFAALNCPRLDCPTVFAWANDEQTRVALQQAFPGRRWYDVVERDNVLRIEAGAP